MLAQAADFRTEVDELHGRLVTLGNADWNRATLFKQWTINDIVQHLHDGDLMAAASVSGPEHFATFRAERQALLDRGMNRLQATRHRFGDLSGTSLRERWYAQAVDLSRQLSALPLDTRLKW